MNKEISLPEYALKNFIELTEEEKDLVLQWRNSDWVRPKMINQEMISREQHWQWLAGLKERRDCLYFLVFIEGEARGVINFTEIDYEKKEAFVGSYVGRKRDVGAGVFLSFLQGKYLFEELRFDRSKAKVLKTNRRAYVYNRDAMGMKPCPDFSDETSWCLYTSREQYFSVSEEVRRGFLAMLQR